MKQLLPFLFAAFTIGCSPLPEQETSFVFDTEEILTKGEENRLDSLLRSHEKKTTNEIVIVTAPDWGDSENALFFSVNFGRNHGIGKSDKNNGIVIVFSKQQRQTRISTGTGIEEILTDQKVNGIIDSLMIPKFKQEEIYEALYHGSNAIVHFLELPENEIKVLTN